MKRILTLLLQVLICILGFLAVWPAGPVPNAIASEQPVSEAVLSGLPSHSMARLVSDVQEIKPGQPFKVGALILCQKGWHTYYKDPGDAGMPTSITWNLPPGFKASELLWAEPKKYNEAGIIAYGYMDRSLVAAEITPPANLKGPAKISATVKWLCCKDLCVPGSADLNITLPVTNGEPKRSELAPDFAKLGWTGDPAKLPTSPEEPGVSTEAPASTGKNGQPATNASQPASTSGSVGAAPAAGSSHTGAGQSSSILNQNLDVQGESKVTLPLSFFFAFVGGFILNFMPCVLPVIALKVVGIVEQAHGDKALIKNHALSFTGGMIGTFLLLAAVVIGIKGSGGGAGWGFLFQYPAFLVAMSSVVLLFSLSLFGLFYIALPNQGSVDKLASRDDLVGSFFKGVLATLLSTPCTAPFLGTALGFALTQNSAIITAIFFTIGLGMAMPYLLLLLRPDLLKFVPKPGVWMEKFKESMGFVLLATVVWLLGILGQVVGAEALVRTIAFLVALSFAAWVVAKFTDLTSTTSRRNTVWAVALLMVAAAFYFFYGQLPGYGLLPLSKVLAEAPKNSAISWQPYTLESLQNALNAKKTVLLDFTADWCLTCKVNEKTVLDSQPVTDKLKALHVVTLQADWTTQNPAISKLLAKFNRSGVPLYIIFPGKDSNKPIVLPEVITQDIVLKALDDAGPSQ